MKYSDLFPTSEKNNFFECDKNTATTSLTYPHNPDYTYESFIEFIDFDKECEADLQSGHGFIVGPFTQKNITKDLLADDGIYSPRFGQGLSDTNRFINRYRCACTDDKGLSGRLHNGLTCPRCGKICRFVDDDLAMFGWLRINDYKIIQPAFYKKIDSFFGGGLPSGGKKRSKLLNILDVANANKMGNISPTDSAKLARDEPFFGIGMIEFQNKFDEIMSFYRKKKASKLALYEDIYRNREKIFTHHIPVFSAVLRPINVSGRDFNYEKTNAPYSVMAKLVTIINKNKTAMQKNPVTKNSQLCSLQSKYMELYQELEKIISGKKGDFRCLIGGRYTFSSRSVIVQNPNLRIDEVTLPLVTLVILLEHSIKNILCRIHNMSPNEADKIWNEARKEPTPVVTSIIDSILNECKASGRRGLCILINRNPTIRYGSILQMFCIGYTKTHTMAVPLQPLTVLNADFDGDTLNILLPINQRFMQLAWQKFNPRNSMYISRNDGYFSTEMCMTRDTLINANTLARCGKENYTKEEIENIMKLLELKKSMM